MMCPNCKLENPPSALKCDCGYALGTRTSEKSVSASAMDSQAPRLTVKDLLGIESRLNRSFYAAVSAYIFSFVLGLFFGPLLNPRANLRENVMALLLVVVILLGAILAFAGYVWYVIAIYQTAKAIHKPYGYLLWAILGPVLSILPIPIVSIALAVTPVTIKFLLSEELRTRARLQTLRDLH
jgi:hypothetical protein